MTKEQIIYRIKADDVYNLFFTNNKQFIGILYREIDGYWTYAQQFECTYWDEDVLFALVEHIRELNKAWDEEIKRYFTVEQIVDSIEVSDLTICDICNDKRDSANHLVGCNFINVSDLRCSNCGKYRDTPNHFCGCSF